MWTIRPLTAALIYCTDSWVCSTFVRGHLTNIWEVLEALWSRTSVRPRALQLWDHTCCRTAAGHVSRVFQQSGKVCVVKVAVCHMDVSSPPDKDRLACASLGVSWTDTQKQWGGGVISQRHTESEEFRIGTLGGSAGRTLPGSGSSTDGLHGGVPFTDCV